MASERWTHTEINDFLNICKKHKILKQMKNKSYRFDDIFQNIKEDMNNLGHKKSIYQMTLKFKKLKKRYKESLNDSKNRQRFEFFNKMKELETESETTVKSDNIDNSNNIISNISSIPDHHNLHNYYKTPKIFGDDVQLNSGLLYDHFDAMTDHTYYDLSFSGYDFDDTRVNNYNNVENNQKNNEDIEKKKDCKDLDKTLKNFVSSFKKAQEELQKSFFKQQEELQKRQQEWEEKMLEKERMFFSQTIKTLMQNSSKRS